MSVHDTLTIAAIKVSVARSDYRQWADRANGDGRTYVGAGHDAVQRIDDALTALHEARRALARELRADEDERAARIDAMLAARTAQNGGEA